MDTSSEGLKKAARRIFYETRKLDEEKQRIANEAVARYRAEILDLLDLCAEASRLRAEASWLSAVDAMDFSTTPSSEAFCAAFEDNCGDDHKIYQFIKELISAPVEDTEDELGREALLTIRFGFENALRAGVYGQVHKISD